MKRHTCRCRRCSGMMIATYADLLSRSQTGEDVIVWRCVNCGDYVDRQVLMNRSAQEERPMVPAGEVRHRSIPQRARTIQIRRRAVAA
jgi:hypothetical protein